MRKTTALLVILVFVVSFVLSACTPKPPPVSEADLNQTIQATEAAESEADKLLEEKTMKEQELRKKQEELKSLKDYKDELIRTGGGK